MAKQYHKSGYWGTPEYRAYIDAKQRCSNPRCRSWKDYGARGIKFLFENFTQLLVEIGPRPTPQHQLDRINNDGNYETGNVRWTTRAMQLSNRREYRVTTAVLAGLVKARRARRFPKPKPETGNGNPGTKMAETNTSK